MRISILTRALGMTIGALLVATGTAAAPPPSTIATLEGEVTSVTPFGDVKVEGDEEGHGQRKSNGDREEQESDHHERRARRSPCALTSGAVLVCATTLDSETPPTCRPLDERRCDFSIELALREEAAVAGIVFVQDEDGSGTADEAERVAVLIDVGDGAPVCGGDVLRIEDVAVDFAEAAPNAAAIHKIADGCTQS